jgi:poly(3-hydroxybutyrate) depolymerase
MQAKAGALSAGLGLAKELMAEDSKMQTAIALAEAVMQTYVAANVALASSPPPLNFINMAGVIATGIANVIKIKKEADKMASETGISNTASSVGGGTTIGPSISMARSNVVDSNVQLKNAMDQASKPPKAYVVGTDIDSQQSLDRKIYSNATLGG